ncbi:DUF3549 family protein [Halomonas campisalis]|uniref:DUF3549 family protein n=1 Tax=Billgrantia campisalis TaxID=74661 RepID=A0ABS9PBW3_9GAMM|nr:DUF3549 family protein [Halomonas campisalis]MCG6659260.1 DUF3549 family protein [Halomonas campisalis]MDR5864259.1 DUF3549 family protein [Halomonas campisalis]
MQPILTLHEFFVRTGAEVRAYHLGRRVEPFALATLAGFEAGDHPWPAPWQGQARLGLVFRLGDMPEPVIWFLALPLDEQGQLVAAPRDAFLQRLLETLGRGVQRVGQPDDGAIDNLMQDNPLAFTPSLPFQAMLHARARYDMGLPASQHLEPVEDYLSGQQTLDWQALGLQGLADFAVRLDAERSQALAERLGELPDQVLTSLCYCLEHVEVPDELAHALRSRGEQAAARGDIESFCACVRALGGASDAIAGDWFDRLLDDPHAGGPDLLAAIAGRGWSHLEHAERLTRYLARLAEEPRADFAAVARDLALIPRLRLPVLMALHEADADSAIGKRLRELTRQAE